MFQVSSDPQQAMDLGLLPSGLALLITYFWGLRLRVSTGFGFSFATPFPQVLSGWVAGWVSIGFIRFCMRFRRTLWELPTVRRTGALGFGFWVQSSGVRVHHTSPRCSEFRVYGLAQKVHFESVVQHGRVDTTPHPTCRIRKCSPPS